MDFLTTTIFSGTFNIDSLIIAFVVATVLGLITASTYMLTHDKDCFSKSHTITLVILPPVIAMIVSLVVPIVGNNLATAFSIAGVFTIIRFRSLPADPKDVAYVALALATGLACGLGYIYIGIVFTVFMVLVLAILKITKFAVPRKKAMLLKITVPEDLNFEGAFDDVLKKYTTDFTIQKVRTCDFGSLYEISYKIKIDEKTSKKEFIDELRTINGNLNIILTQKEFELE